MQAEVVTGFEYCGEVVLESAADTQAGPEPFDFALASGAGEFRCDACAVPADGLVVG